MSEPDYKGFAKWAISKGSFCGLSLDGGNIQGAALKFGIIEEVIYDPDVHGDNDVDVQPGDPWFVFVK
jgi:hypothetical protein